MLVVESGNEQIHCDCNMKFVCWYSNFVPLQSSIGKCIEWKPTEVLVDSETHDQEWAMVNAVGRRNRTSSGKFFIVFHLN
jgi:hypothetical protein